MHVLLTGLPLASLSVVRVPAVANAVLLVEGAAIVALDSDGVDPAAVERLAAVTEERVAAGTVVLRQGDPADDLYVLVEGTLGVDHTADGVVRRVNELAAPDYVGEIGLVQHRPGTATVTAAAAADVLLWRLPGPLFWTPSTGVSVAR